MPSAINIIVDVGRLAKQAIRPYTTSPRHSEPDDRLTGWISFEDFIFYSSDPAAFRRVAKACNEAAALIDVAVHVEIPKEAEA